MPPDELAAIQRRMWSHVTAPERPPVDPGWIASSDPAARLDVYRGMYLVRLVEVLRSDYPKVRTVLGDEGFDELAGAYVRAFPSDDPSVRHVGRHLPRFLADAPRDPPWLADLAALEWSRGLCFDAAGAPLLAPARLRATPPDRWAALRLAPVPSLRLLRADWPVHEVWAALDAGEEPLAVATSPSQLVLWRLGHRVWFRPVLPAEAELLELLLAGATFGELCERAAAGVDEEHAATSVLERLGRWIGDGMLADR